MTIKTIVLSLVAITSAAAAHAGGRDATQVDAPPPAEFVNTWHGLGDDHQSGETGTASSRHGFQTGLPAGGSTRNPTTGSQG